LIVGEIMRTLIIVTLFLAAFSWSAFPSHTADGVVLPDVGRSPMKAYVIAAVPAAPYPCRAESRGDMIYVDDTNDTDEADICFCGIDADDVTYIWMTFDDHTVDCF
jgi:hypothetical protein